MAPRRPRRRRSLLPALLVLGVAVAAVALVRTGYIGEGQDLHPARADQAPPATGISATLPSDAPGPEPVAPEKARGPESGSQTAEPPTAAATTRVMVYWPRGDLTALTSAEVDVSAVAPLGGALAALDKEVPSGAAPVGAVQELRTVTRRGDTAILDFEPDFLATYPTASAEEIALLAPLTYTATSLPGITRVLITVGGSPAITPGSFDLAEPLGRASFPGLGE